MARKKSPSFDIPDVVRRAGQSGWVYRTDGPQAAPRPGRGERRATRPEAPPAAASTRTAATLRDAPIGAPVTAAAASAAPDTPAPCPTTTSGLIGFGLHVAAVPFVVPLYVTAAISRRLGLAGR